MCCLGPFGTDPEPLGAARSTDSSSNLCVKQGFSPAFMQLVMENNILRPKGWNRKRCKYIRLAVAHGWCLPAWCPLSFLLRQHIRWAINIKLVDCCWCLGDQLRRGPRNRNLFLPRKIPADVWIFPFDRSTCDASMHRKFGRRCTGWCTYPTPVALPQECYLIFSQSLHVWSWNGIGMPGPFSKRESRMPAP